VTVASLLRAHPDPKLLLTWAMLAVSAYAAARPGSGLWHHLLIMMVPVWFLFCGSFAVAAKGHDRRLQWGVAISGLVILFGLKVSQDDHPVLGLRLQVAERQVEFAGQIKRHLRLGDKLALWGWNPDLRIQTGYPQATRFATSAMAVTSGGEIRRYFTDQFVADLDRERPRILVDTTGTCDPLMPERAEKSLQHPDFQRILRDYQLLEEQVCGRIYTRRTDIARGDQLKQKE
jgi:hypothetical protein